MIMDLLRDTFESKDPNFQQYVGKKFKIIKKREKKEKKTGTESGLDYEDTYQIKFEGGGKIIALKQEIYK